MYEAKDGSGSGSGLGAFKPKDNVEQPGAAKPDVPKVNQEIVGQAWGSQAASQPRPEQLNQPASEVQPKTQAIPQTDAAPAAKSPNASVAATEGAALPSGTQSKPDNPLCPLERGLVLKLPTFAEIDAFKKYMPQAESPGSKTYKF